MSSGVILMIHGGSQAVVASGPSPPPLVDLKEKRAHSSSLAKGAGKAKKSKGLPLPTDLVSSSSKAPVMEAMMEVEASLRLGVATLADASEAPKGREEGLVAITKTQVKIGKAQVSTVKSLM